MMSWLVGRIRLEGGHLNLVLVVGEGHECPDEGEEHLVSHIGDVFPQEEYTHPQLADHTDHVLGIQHALLRGQALHHQPVIDHT